MKQEKKWRNINIIESQTGEHDLDLKMTNSKQSGAESSWSALNSGWADEKWL